MGAGYPSPRFTTGDGPVSETYIATIGLETHVQLTSHSKLFSSCPSGEAAEPNIHVDPVSFGLPGALPVLNRGVMEGAVRVGLALNCSIADVCSFDRKHYFYPDLPKGYQITQDRQPICRSGLLAVEGESGTFEVRINRIHIEEDAGKTIHDSVRGQSRVDYNRAGTPLIEIVTEPDLGSPEDAVSYLRRLHETVVFLGVTEGDMEAGNFRFDANVSLRPMGASTLGTKVELKNMNSFRFLKRALEYEIQRQGEILDTGGKIVQETRTWDENREVTVSMRSKESAPDYRYLPEPDIPWIQIEFDWVEHLRATQPELAHQKRKRYTRTLGLSDYDAGVLTAERDLAVYFENVLKETSANAQAVSNWITSELLGLLARHSDAPGGRRPTAKEMGVVLNALDRGELSGRMGKAVLEKIVAEGVRAQEAIDALGGVVSGEETLRPIVQEVIRLHPEQVGEFRSGKVKIMGFLMGQVMKLSQGKADPKEATQMLREEMEP